MLIGPFLGGSRVVNTDIGDILLIKQGLQIIKR
jgi:hypothetical protein